MTLNIHKLAEIKSSNGNWDTPKMDILKPQNVEAPPAFPLDVFPEPVQQWLKDTAEAKSVPVDYIACPTLTVISTLLGNTVYVSPWSGWEEFPHIWLCIIGAPSSGKTHSIKAAITILIQLETNAKKKAKSPTAIKGPVNKRLVINDATIEAVINILARNPHGLLCFRDELSGWLGSMNQYKSNNGGDRSFWLEAYNGNPYTYDRVKNDEEVHIPHLGLSVVGGIQPDKVRRIIADKDDDGFVSRFLFVYPKPLPPQTPKSEVDNTGIMKAAQKLYDLRPSETDLKPTPIGLADDAVTVFEQYRQKTHIQEEQADESSFLYTAIGKNNGRVLRIAAILQYMDWAVSDSEKPPTVISVASLQSAIDLMEDYFMPMMKRSLNTAMLSQDMRNATKIARHIVKNKLLMINRRTLQQEHVIGSGNIEELKNALDALMELGWIKDAEDEKKSGRKRSDYRVNPMIHV